MGKVALSLVAAFGIIGLIGIGAYSVLDKPNHIDYYRVVDEQTLLMGTTSGQGANVRVTSVVETAERVTITVSAFLLELGAGTAAGYPYESEARLSSPLGGRIVIDGSSGLPVQRANCPPPSYFAEVCT